MIFIPLRLSFNIDKSKNYSNFYIFFDFIPYFIFIIDIILTLHTGYFLKGIFICQKSKILKNYLQNEFFLDIVTLIPLTIIIFISNYIFLEIIVLLRIFKLIKKFKNMEEFLHLSEKSQGFLFNVNKTIINYIKKKKFYKFLFFMKKMKKIIFFSK